ncbi:unnamed protein product [Rangifer tarandus platyrhynchus]|uniref:Uncharacterized protein n=2 Tax=Rangifer tarandus platyrhynchus TaxID=3082113 RepID=A0ACB0DWP9_RANTA|nr:unnamed protein product [Rangifer tarandus platyrhynchus]CAI9692732.1 unnamed protein product [Rangifer tarandus platyrhynchus]
MSKEVKNPQKPSVRENECDTNHSFLTIKRSPRMPNALRSPAARPQVPPSGPSHLRVPPPCGGAGPGRRRRADVRAWGQPGVVRRGEEPAGPAAARSVCVVAEVRVGSLGLLPFPSSRPPRPGRLARRDAVGAPGAAPLRLGEAASAARGHHAYP